MFRWGRCSSAVGRMGAEVTTMAVPPGTELPAPHRGGRPRDPSREAAIRAALLRLLGEVGYGGAPLDAPAPAGGGGKATNSPRWRTTQGPLLARERQSVVW